MNDMRKRVWVRRSSSRNIALIVLLFLLNISMTLSAQIINDEQKGLTGFPPETIVNVGEKVGDYYKLTLEQPTGNKETIWTESFD